MERSREIGIYNDKSHAYRTLKIQITGNDVGAIKLLADSITKFRDFDSLEISLVFFKDLIKNSLLVLLATAVSYYVYQLKRVIVIIDTSTKGGDYIAKLNFLKYWNKDRVRFLRSEINSQRIFNLWRIEENLESTYAYFLDEHFKRVPETENRNLASIINAIGEAILNVSHHSKSGGMAYVMTGLDESKKRIECSVYDCGFGIPQTLRNNVRYLGASNSQALELALKPRVTSQSKPNNQGMGLFVILSAIMKNKGQLTVTSEDVTISYSSDTDTLVGVASAFYIKGTWLSFEVDLDNLEIKSTLEQFYGRIG